MAVFFSGNELLEVAVGIEKNGEAFYRALADKTRNQDAKAIYGHLAGEERKHLSTFQGMLNSVGIYQPPETYAGEYMLYLKSLIDNTVFSDITDAQQRAEKTSSEMDAFNTGIQAEKDSILFYVEIQNLVRESDRQLVQNIINEEKGHLRQLHELKQVAQKG